MLRKVCLFVYKMALLRLFHLLRKLTTERFKKFGKMFQLAPGPGQL
jgi:hypothetical protein